MQKNIHWTGIAERVQWLGNCHHLELGILTISPCNQVRFYDHLGQIKGDVQLKGIFVI